MAYVDHEIQYQRAPALQSPSNYLQDTSYINEQGERDEHKMSLNAVLNNDSAYDPDDKIVDIKSEDGDGDSRSPSPLSYAGGALVPIQSTPSSSATNRALCHICKSESGRCHASDPATMQAFFATTLGFEGALSTSDWLCMKCYSKWYNRCKRKAASNTLAAEGPATTPSKRRKREKDGFAQKRDRERSSDNEKDTDSDDALLLARMGSQYPSQFSPVHVPATSAVSTPIQQEDSRDSESGPVETEVDYLREEMRVMKSEMARMIQQQAKRDEQVEELLTFVRTEFSAMHDIFKELAEGRWGKMMMVPSPSPATSSQSIPIGMMTNPMAMMTKLPNQATEFAGSNPAPAQFVP